MRWLGLDCGAWVFIDNAAALELEAAAVSVAAAAASGVVAAKADLGPLSEGDGSGVDPSPSKLGRSCKDLKVNVSKLSKAQERKSTNLPCPLTPAARAAALTVTAIPQ